MSDSSQTYTFKQRLILAIVPPMAYMIICLLGVTLRYEDVCEPGVLPAYHMPRPLIYALWHRCLLACAWRFRNGGIHILISRSFDGELIARTVERLGFVAVRGSSSRDGAAGLRNLQRAYLEKNYCAITADGPRGPAQIAKPGVTQLAKLVDGHVGALHLHPHRAWVLRSWDRFLIPKPFSRVTVGWAAFAPAEQSAVQSALDRAVEIAESGSPEPHLSAH
ncbi:lysophospholipid acyltransferase family protein [Edaphobacter aggregans]|uniref:lysophospholipid acyltransferase family protein n=1 Tax=Edaphobacter aggregans TaxID=570835 RepID=UPI0005593383|nr:lysophospholipid acyltransferase family protein [Edaphobacter aggregans]